VTDPLSILWLMLPGQRSFRELHWLSMMPGSLVTAIGSPTPPEPVTHLHRGYIQPTHRYVEAGAIAWLRDVGSIPGRFDFVASLEMCSLVTGQATTLARKRGMLQSVIVWANDPRSPLYWSPPHRRSLRRSRNADLFLCMIEAAREHCVALGVPDERCEVVLPGVDLELFHPPRAPVEEPVCLFVSPLAANKGIDTVLDAFALVRAQQPDARLWVAGQGPLEALVRTRAADSGGAIRYLGPLGRERVAQAMRQAAVFVTAPRPTRVWSEQFGIAYVEAMASGLPIVTTVCGSNHEAVRPPNVRTADDARQIADALGLFLGDAALRRQVGETNRRVAAESHDLRRQVELMSAAFHRARKRARNEGGASTGA